MSNPTTLFLQAKSGNCFKCLNKPICGVAVGYRNKSSFCLTKQRSATQQGKERTKILMIMQDFLTKKIPAKAVKFLRYKIKGVDSADVNDLFDYTFLKQKTQVSV